MIQFEFNGPEWYKELSMLYNLILVLSNIFMDSHTLLG